MATFLNFVLVICVSTCVHGFDMSGRIDTDKNIFVMSTPYYGLYGIHTFTYEISFPEMYGPVNLLAFPKKEMSMTMNSNKSCAAANFHWHRTLHSSEPSCQHNGDDIYGRMIKCNGRFDLTDYSGEEFYFAISNCNGGGIKATHYFLMDGMEVRASASSPASASSTNYMLAFIAAATALLRK
ncbi:uncharacterized protein LOC124149708 [Haliotis rufescens]|uniref:uncharacterized protein LOC124149708 n=1 Tax=Haliotis rufescens TaxID=6454 RepID=UPI00201F7D95|nr:uncharacterized protein LOC124149708 [Haliotis rufescens]